MLAAAKEQGPLRNYNVPLTEETLARLRELTPKGVLETVLPTLVRYYLAHRQPDTDWVVLPVVNLDAFFGTTSFSHTWLKELPEEVILRDRKRKDPCRYLVHEEFLRNI